MRKLPIAAVTLTALFGIACGAGGADTKGPGAQGDTEASTPADRKAAGTKTITFEVTGGGKADITYQVTSDQSQDNGAALPWSKTVTSKEALLVPTLVASSRSESDNSSIRCKITVGGKVVKENASKGAYATVSCTAYDLDSA